MTTPRVTRYSIGVFNSRTGEREVVVEEADHEQGTWAIRDGGPYCLNHLMEWEYEPFPSNRDAAFFERCRWKLDEALVAAQKVYEETMVELREAAERRANRSV